MINRILILLILAILNACGKVSVESNIAGSNSISGIIHPLVGLIANNKNQQSLFPTAYAVPCTDPVYATLYELDTNGQQQSTALATLEVKSDAKYNFNASALNINLDSNIQYIVEVTGCDYLFSRPVTAINLEQHINIATTYISFATTANLSKNLREVSRTELESFMKELQGNSFNNVSMMINASPSLTTKFQTIFGSNISDLEKAAPKIVYYTIPSVLTETNSASFQVNTIHPDPLYDTVYKWKLNGTLKSSNPNWNFTPTANDQGSHLISLYIGKNDGSGNVDLTESYLVRTFLVNVLNSVLPTAPTLSIANTTVEVTGISLDMDTGFAQTSCDSFEKLALTENMAVAPTDPNLYTLTCSQAISQTIPFTISANDGVKVLRLWAMDSAGVISSTPKVLSVTLNTGIASLAHTSVAVSSSSIASAATTTVTLTARNSANALITSGGLNVEFYLTDGDSTGDFSAVTDNGDGTYTATLTGEISGSASTLKAKINGLALTSTFPTVEVTPGPFSLAASTLDIDNETIASGDTLTASLTPKDINGNLFPTGITTVTMTSSIIGGTATISAATAEIDGTYTAIVTGVVAGSVTLTGNINGSALTSAQSVVTVTTGTVSVATSLVTVSATTVESASSITVTLAAKDAAGNQLSTGGLVVTFSRTGGTSTGTFPGTTTDNGNGTYTRTFTGVVSGTATTINAAIGGVTVTKLPKPTVSVTPSTASAITSLITSSASSVNSGNSVTLTLTTKDAANNSLVTGGRTVLFTKTTGAGKSTGTISATTDNGNGTYTATFTGILAGTATTIGATINGVVVSSTPVPAIIVNSGIISVAQSTVTVSSNTVGSTETITATVQAKDAAGNNLTTGGSTILFSHSGGTSTGTFSATTDNANGTYSSVFTGAIAGTATTINATIGGAAITSAPLPTVLVGIGSASAAVSTIALSAASVASGSDITATLTAKDSGSNLIPSGGLTVTFDYSGGASTVTVANTTDNGDGTYTALLTGVIAGTATSIRAYINGTQVTTSTPALTVNVGPLSLAGSTITVPAATVASNVAALITLTTRDAAGNIITGSGNTVAFTLTGGTSTGNLSAVTAVGNGTYTATYTGILVGTAHTIDGTINGSAVTNPSLPTLEVIPGAANKLVFATQPSNTTVSTDVLATTPVVHVLDINNNLVTGSSLAITLAGYTNSTCTTAAVVNTGAVAAVTATLNPKAATNGVSTFANVKVTNVYNNATAPTASGIRYIRAAAAGVSVACSQAITVSTGAPTKLKFFTNNNPGVAGVNFTIQPKIEITDDNFNRVITATDAITLSPYTAALCATPKAGTLNGVNPVTAVNGLATFAGINFTTSGTLAFKATTTGLTAACQTPAVTLLPDAANQLTITGTSNWVEQGDCSKSFIVKVADQYGNQTATNKTVTLATSGSAILYSNSNCSTPITADVTTVSGAYTFYVKDNTAEALSLTATTAGWPAANYAATVYPVSAMVAGYYNSCKIVNGSLECSGLNNNSMLGNGVAVNSVSWVVPTGITSGVTKVAMGQVNTVFIQNDELYMVGAYNYGQAGNGTVHATTDKLTPFKVATLIGSVVDASVSSANLCAVVDGTLTGELWCWGLNTSYQVGDNTNVTRTTPVKIVASGATAVSSSSLATSNCAIINGAAKCWGANASGQLGDNTFVTKKVPTQVTGLTAGVTQVSMGVAHACAIVNGGLKCWGSNAYGQVGDGTLINSAVPVDVPGLESGVEQVSAGNSFTCAIKTGSLYCWGYNADGRTGQIITPNGSPYTTLPSLIATGVTDVSAGVGHGCAVINGKSHCWGLSHYGGLALTNINNSWMTAPVPTTLTSGVTQVSMGLGHACAIKDGGVHCWGAGSYGQLGDGNVASRFAPQPVTGLGSNVLKIATGANHSCAMMGTIGSATVKCWGYNLVGQLGDTTLVNKLTPVTVTGLPSNVTAIAAGNNHSCAVVNQTDVYCWGDAAYGQLGYGSTVDKTSAFLIPPANFPVGAVISKIVAGTYFTCALVNDAVYCWGINTSGQIGAGAILPAYYYIPQPTLITSGATDLRSGNNNTCAIVSGSIQCWGYNNDKMILNSAVLPQPIPIVSAMTTNTNVTELSVGQLHICAKVDGLNKCWGNNLYGQLGNGNLVATGATAVTPGTVTTPIEAGNYVSCTIDAGALSCWGSNYGNLLGSLDYAPFKNGPTSNP